MTRGDNSGKTRNTRRLFFHEESIHEVSRRYLEHEYVHTYIRAYIHTDKPKPICPLLFQSWGHKNSGEGVGRGGGQVGGSVGGGVGGGSGSGFGVRVDVNEELKFLGKFTKKNRGRGVGRGGGQVGGRVGGGSGWM